MTQNYFQALLFMKLNWTRRKCSVCAVHSKQGLRHARTMHSTMNLFADIQSPTLSKAPVFLSRVVPAWLEYSIIIVYQDQFNRYCNSPFLNNYSRPAECKCTVGKLSHTPRMCTSRTYQDKIINRKILVDSLVWGSLCSPNLPLAVIETLKVITGKALLISLHWDNKEKGSTFHDAYI